MKRSVPLIVYLQILFAVIILAAIFAVTVLVLPLVQEESAASRIVYASKLAAFVALPLIAGLSIAIRMRAVDDQLIRGYTAAPSDNLAFILAYNSNTLEQTVLHCLALLSFARRRLPSAYNSLMAT